MPQNHPDAASSTQTIIATAPGRICLFGEHQDYLGLPVIAMAVDREFRIEFTPTADAKREFTIHTPDLPDTTPQILDIHAQNPRSDDDYCWGIGQTLLEEGFSFPYGGDAVFRSNIPFRAGCSSSSAMSAAWMRLLLEIGEHPRRSDYIDDPERVAYLVYKGEKEKFAGAGGMMDQYSCYLGGLLYVYPEGYPGTPAVAGGQAFGVEGLELDLDGIILIDSGQPKDTQGILSSVGDRARQAVASARQHIDGFQLPTISRGEYEARQTAVPEPQRTIVRDHIINRDLCSEGIAMFRSGSIDAARLGAMLNEEHRILSQTLGIATPLIDEIQELCGENGALGGKINGSGGGGTLFCYAPEPQGRKKVLQVLADRHIRYFPVRKSDGARILPA